MNTVREAKLVKGDGTSVAGSAALEGKTIVCFYFSAHWCPPCKAFTPVLKDFYEEVSQLGVEIIFVSSDRSQQEMESYMKESHGSWLAVEHGSDVAQQLKHNFGISGIPALIVCRADGTLISKNGRTEVQTAGPQALTNWK